jgi:exodeoxyribonuclease VII large subunit
MALKPISVTQLNGYLKGILDMEDILQNIAVVGEICDLSIRAGNAWLCLKDEQTLIECVIFGLSTSFKHLAEIIKNGEKVILTGKVDYYIKTGKVKFKAHHAETVGVGALLKQFIELKNRLEAQGLFDSKYKKQLPQKITRVGVITSPKGAVIHDISTVIKRRSPNIEVVIYPSLVQGENAPASIIEGVKFFDSLNKDEKSKLIDNFNSGNDGDKSKLLFDDVSYENKNDNNFIKSVDVVIIARGGGSDEDLSCFNNETLAKTIFNAGVPIISAVGHETNFTICDFVSDMRAATPSVAAEIVSEDIFNKISSLKWRLVSVIEKEIEKQKSVVDKAYISKKRLNFAIKNLISNYENDLKLYKGRLEQFNPENIYKQGYGLILKQGKTATYSVIQTKDTLQVVMREGILDIQVLDKKPHKKQT